MINLSYLKEIYLVVNNLRLGFYKIDLISYFVGEFPKQKSIFVDWARKNNCKVFLLKNKGSFIKKPKTIEKEVHKNFPEQYVINDKEIFIGLIKNARLLSKNANIITSDNYDINDDVSFLGRSMTSFENYLILPKMKYADSRVLSISNSNNYFHWMFEILPRIHFINKTKLHTDFYLLPKNKSFHKDSIKALKIKETDIIELNEKTHIEAKEVLFSSMPIYSGNPTLEVCLFLRKLFLKKYGKSKYKKYEKIYVCRGNVTHRKVSNEQRVINFLEKKGFISIKMDGLSVFEQAKIFNSAKVIVSPHGAALSNLVFCKNGTKVIEFFHPDYVNSCYWILGNLVNLDYHYFLADKLKFNFGQDSLVNIYKLDRSLVN